jgi:8-amino-7-oxononanoate synthase
MANHTPFQRTARYQAWLEARQAQSQLRRCRVVTPLEGAQCLVDGQPAINFCSNNYLGLAADSRLKAVAIAAIEQYGVGTGSARLVSGTAPLVAELEATLAEFKQAEAALVFNSGYQANVAILQALTEDTDTLFLDKWNHASLVDGALLCGARWTRYAHGDLNHLEARLKAAHQKRSVDSAFWIVTDSVFSMDGDWAPLAEMVTLAERYDACLMVDEAHATGVYGPVRSSGLAEELGLSQAITLQMGTLSKALGGMGGYVAGSRVLIDTLINRGRGFIYSTAMPPASVAAALAAVKLVQEDRSVTQRLWANHALLQQLAQEVGLPLQSPSPIFPWVVGDAPTAMAWSEQLLAAGYFVQGIRPPTVPEGTARLRITLSAHHTPEQIQGLVSALRGLPV